MGIVRHLTYANVIATIALVIALGGGVAVAANTIRSTDIVDGQVKTPDLGTDAVRSVKIADESLTAADLGYDSVGYDEIQANAVQSPQIADNSVGGSDVLNGSLDGSDIQDGTITGGDIANGTVSSGDIGPEAVGISELGVNAVTSHSMGQGAIPSRVYTNTGVTAKDTTASKELTVNCDTYNPDDRVTGGGYVVDGASGTVSVTRNYAVADNSWLVRARASGSSPWALTVVADCVD